MGEELKELKTYFKTSEDDSEWNELKEIENVGISFESEEYKEYMKRVSEAFYRVGKSVEEFNNKFTTACEVIIDEDLIRQWKKLAGLSPLSKKRTRKLLMAHGFDRDSAQMYADTMYPRNMNAIKELIEIAENSGI